MSDFAPENVTSAFVETDLSIGQVASTLHPPLYPNPFAEIVVEENAMKSFVRECLEVRGVSNDAEDVMDVFGGGEAEMRSGPQWEGFTIADALRRANLIATFDLETVIDTPGIPFFKCHLYDNL